MGRVIPEEEEKLSLRNVVEPILIRAGSNPDQLFVRAEIPRLTAEHRGGGQHGREHKEEKQHHVLFHLQIPSCLDERQVFRSVDINKGFIHGIQGPELVLLNNTHVDQGIDVGILVIPCAMILLMGSIQALE